MPPRLTSLSQRQLTPGADDEDEDPPPPPPSPCLCLLLVLLVFYKGGRMGVLLPICEILWHPKPSHFGPLSRNPIFALNFPRLFVPTPKWITSGWWDGAWVVASVWRRQDDEISTVKGGGQRNGRDVGGGGYLLKSFRHFPYSLFTTFQNTVHTFKYTVHIHIHCSIHLHRLTLILH